MENIDGCFRFLKLKCLTLLLMFMATIIRNWQKCHNFGSKMMTIFIGLFFVIIWELKTLIFDFALHERQEPIVNINQVRVIVKKFKILNNEGLFQQSRTPPPPPPGAKRETIFEWNLGEQFIDQPKLEQYSLRKS